MVCGGFCGTVSNCYNIGSVSGGNYVGGASEGGAVMNTCGDCIHAEVCEGMPSIPGFNRENPAYCKRFRAEMKWIPVTERLPEDDVRVLALHDDGVVRIGISKGGFAMPRLIDADALMEREGISQFAVFARGSGKTLLRACRTYLQCVIDDAPTVDPEDLRPKGRWIEVDGEVFDCSVCHGIHASYPHNYCPECGAKMEVT